MLQNTTPLAAALRPETLLDFIGQAHLLGEGKPLWRILHSGLPHSMILCGPPGTGKTTLAKLIAKYSKAKFLTLSAIMSGAKEIRNAIEIASEQKTLHNQKTILFVDEVHRFNKSQQDIFLPFVEDGTLIFIGATTENPSFEINNALLSRCRVYRLELLSEQDLLTIIERAIGYQMKISQKTIHFDKVLRTLLAQSAQGDARQVLNLTELALSHAKFIDSNELRVDEETLQSLRTSRVNPFDKKGDFFYDQISALHKSVRGSSPDGALYWFACLLTNGADPLYIARRVVRMATEDIGNADPRALEIALNAWDVQERLGSPEGELAIAQAIVYLSVAPKSNAVYAAFEAAKKDVCLTGALPVPLHLRNAPTTLTRAMGHGKHYRYDHEEPNAFAAGQTYFPDGLEARTYYHPVSRGLEIKIQEKLKLLKSLLQPIGKN